MKNLYIKATELNERIVKHFKNKDLISVEDLISTIEDLDYEIEFLNEKIEQIEEDIEDNYIPMSVSSQVGINNHDFI